MTIIQYFRLTGLSSKDDDIERITCKHAGDLLHKFCGMCKHKFPLWLCFDCIRESIGNK